MQTLLRLIIVVIVLTVGVSAMVMFFMMRQPPKQATAAEQAIRVETMIVEPRDVPVHIDGFGEARALNVVSLAPEVSGNVVGIHPRLEQGEVVPAGELLFKIDPRDYDALLAQAEASVAQAETALTRLKQQYEIDKSRLKTVERTRDLAKAEYVRARDLLEKDDVGTQSGVDAAEMGANQARDAYDQLHQAVTLYPARIQEAEAGLAAARAQRDLAATNRARTEVRVDFDARVENVQVELGEYLRAATPVLTLADDSVLELLVSVDSRDARSWLRFEDNAEPNGAWFDALEPVACKLAWVEAPETHQWTGTLDRVTDFDTQNRTITVAIRVNAAAARSGRGQIPLVAGMFCSVQIPGRPMRGVYELPRWTVTFEDEVYVAENQRLAIRPVKSVRSQGDQVYISEGLTPGMEVIVTRLVDPAPNTLLDIRNEKTAEAAL